MADGLRGTSPGAAALWRLARALPSHPLSGAGAAGDATGRERHKGGGKGWPLGFGEDRTRRTRALQELIAKDWFFPSFSSTDRSRSIIGARNCLFATSAFKLESPFLLTQGEE